MSVADEIKKLAELLESGAITSVEFEQAKAGVLHGRSAIHTSDVPETKGGIGLPAKIALTTALVVLAFLGFGFFQSHTPQGKQRAEDRLGIEACWNEYKTKARDQATREFIAGACDLMEKNFESTHGRKP